MISYIKKPPTAQTNEFTRRKLIGAYILCVCLGGFYVVRVDLILKLGAAMKILPAVILVVMLFTYGCGSSLTSIPNMPSFTANAEKVCARSCQKTYVDCTQSYSMMATGLVYEKNDSIFSNCNQILGECYSTCE